MTSCAVIDRVTACQWEEVVIWELGSIPRFGVMTSRTISTKSEGLVIWIFGSVVIRLVTGNTIRGSRRKVVGIMTSRTIVDRVSTCEWEEIMIWELGSIPRLSGMASRTIRTKS